MRNINILQQTCHYIAVFELILHWCRFIESSGYGSVAIIGAVVHKVDVILKKRESFGVRRLDIIDKWSPGCRDYTIDILLTELMGQM